MSFIELIASVPPYSTDIIVSLKEQFIFIFILALQNENAVTRTGIIKQER